MNLKLFRRCLLAYALFDFLIGYAGFFPGSEMAAAQFTTVTCTVTDPNGLPYANGTIVPTLISSGTPVFIGGLGYTPPTQPIGLDSNGKCLMQLADNTQLLPASSKWNFQVCSGAGSVQPAGGKGPVCFSLATPITISGASQDISASLNAVALTLSTPNGVIQFPGAPSGPCSAGQLAVNQGTGAVSWCNGGTWSLIAAAAGATAFSSVTAGTNTLNLLMGTGGSLGTSGTGIINANQLNGTALSGLGTGILKNTTGTGVPSIAVAGDFPTLNQNTTGTSASATNFTGSLTGDVSGTQGATSVNKINGISLAGLATGVYKNTTGTGVPSILAVQGTDANILSAGAVAGTSAPLCTDASGGATTVSCPTIAGVPVGTQGQPLINNNGNLGYQTSSAWIDTSIFAGSDFCAKTNAAYVALGAAGGTLDARGFSDPQNCIGTNMFSNSTFRVVNMLLPRARIFLTVPQVMPAKGSILRGAGQAATAGYTTGGTIFIAANAAGPRGDNGTGKVFPDIGYTMNWYWPHPPFFSFPPIQALTQGSCATLPKAHLVAANISGGALTGTAVIDVNGGSGCVNPTFAIGFSGNGTGGTVTCTACTGTVTTLTVSGGSGYLATQGSYSAMFYLGGMANNGTCGAVPVGGSCDGTGATGGWTADAFNSYISEVVLDENATPQVFGLYSKNGQEGGGWERGSCNDMGANASCTFWDNADILNTTSHATHSTFRMVQANGNGAVPLTNTWGHVFQGAGEFVNLTKGSCANQPFAAITSITSGNPTGVTVTYNGGNGAGNAGCNTTPPTCGIMSASGNGFTCTVTIGTSADGTQTNVITGISLVGAGDGNYPPNVQGGNVYIGQQTLNGNSAAGRIAGGILTAGSNDPSVFGLHCEFYLGAAVTGVLGYLNPASNIGSCLRIGTGNEINRAGFFSAVDVANQPAAAANIYVSGGSDNNQNFWSMSEAVIATLVQDDNNNASSGVGGCAPCSSGTTLSGATWQRADTYSPGGLVMPNQIVLGTLQDTGISRGVAPATLNVGSANNGDSSGAIGTTTYMVPFTATATLSITSCAGCAQPVVIDSTATTASVIATGAGAAADTVIGFATNLATAGTLAYVAKSGLVTVKSSALGTNCIVGAFVVASAATAKTVDCQAAAPAIGLSLGKVTNLLGGAGAANTPIQIDIRLR